LFAGFAEDLFSAMPRLVHSLDLAAEDTDSEAYRDLLREIDRAFQSFDQLAVRHAWLSGGDGLEPAPQEGQPAIDLTAFVRSVLVPEADGYRVPPAWGRDLHGLPGFDEENGVVRLTDDPERMRDSGGRPLMYPGRSHPLTRRAIASVRTGRVSAARGQKRSLLMTYAVEAGSLLRTVFALLLSPDGTVREQDDFLLCAKDPVPPDGLWREKFASWAPEALVAADVRAVEVGERIASVAAVAHQDHLARQDAVVHAWLIRRANELCGPVQARTGDLFSPEPTGTDWRSCEVPEQRMAGFAADPTVPIARRREAADALERSTAKPLPFPRPAVRTLGMLMLVP
jgi:hypothetical protein